MGTTDDPLEQEADRVAEDVLRTPRFAWNVAPRSYTPISPVAMRVMRQCAACAEEEERTGQKVQRRAQPAAPEAVGAAPPVVERALQSGGAPLDPEARAFFEPRFGHDFSQVRVHADATAAASARAVNALAYTVGPSIVFGEGRYAPGSAEGRRLLAHELAHVVQQSPHGPAQAASSAVAVSPSPAHVARDAPKGPAFKVDPIHEKMLNALIAVVRSKDDQHKKAVTDVFSVPKDQAINTVLRLNTYTDAFAKFFWASVPGDVQQDVIATLTSAAGPDGPVPTAPTPAPGKQPAAAPPADAAGKQPAPAAGAADEQQAPAVSAADAAAETALAQAIKQAIPEGRFAFAFTELDARDMKPMLRVLDVLGADEIGTLLENLHAPHSDGRFVERLKCALVTVQIGKGGRGDVTAVTAGIELINKQAQTLAILAYVESHATSESAKELLGVLEPKTPEPAQGGGGTSAAGILKGFKAAVRTKALAALDGNVAAVGEEEAKYADTREGSPVWEKLRRIAAPLLSRDRRLKQAAEAFEEQAQKADRALQGVEAKAKSDKDLGGASGASAASPVDLANTAVAEQKEFAASQPGASAGAPAESTGDAVADLRTFAGLWKQKAENARHASRELHAAYPILAAGTLLHDEGKEGASGASAAGPASNEELFKRIRVETFGTIRGAIARSKERLSSDDDALAQLDPIIRSVEQEMHLDQPEHAAEKKVVDAWIEESKSKEEVVQLAFAGATFALGIAAFITGGAGAVVLGLLGSGVGLAGAAINLDQVAVKNDLAISGDVGDPLLDDPDEAKAAVTMAVIDFVLSGIDFAVAVHQASAAAKLSMKQRAAAKQAERAAAKGGEAAKDAKAAEGAAKPAEGAAAKPAEAAEAKPAAAEGGEKKPAAAEGGEKKPAAAEGGEKKPADAEGAGAEKKPQDAENKPADAASKPAAKPTAEGQVPAGEEVVAERRTVDGKHALKITKKGAFVCTTCEALNIKYRAELAANEELQTEWKAVQATENPDAKAEACAKLEQKLSAERLKGYQNEPDLQTKVKTLEKLQTDTKAAIERIEKNLKDPGNVEALSANTEARKVKAEIDQDLREINQKWNEHSGEVEGAKADATTTDVLREDFDDVRVRVEQIEAKIASATTRPVPKQITIGKQVLTPSFEGDAVDFLEKHPAYRDKFMHSMEKGLVGPKKQTGIVRSQEEGYQYKLKILNDGGNYRIHGRIDGNRIIWDKVTTHD